MEEALILFLITLIHRNGGSITLTDEEIAAAWEKSKGLKPIRTGTTTVLTALTNETTQIH